MIARAALGTVFVLRKFLQADPESVARPTSTGTVGPASAAGAMPMRLAKSDRMKALLGKRGARE